MFTSTFQYEVNSAQQTKKKKNLGTMCAPRSNRAALTDMALEKTELQRKKLGITSTKAKGVTEQQQSSSSTSNAVESGQRQHKGPLEQVHQQQQQDIVNMAVNGIFEQIDCVEQNIDQTCVNVTTCTERVVECSMAPSVSPTRPKRKAAQAAALLFQQQQQQQLKRRTKLVRCPIERDSRTPPETVEESNNENELLQPTNSVNENVANIEAATGKQLVASLTLDPVEEETGEVATMTAEERKSHNNRLKRQRKIANRQNDTSVKMNKTNL